MSKRGGGGIGEEVEAVDYSQLSLALPFTKINTFFCRIMKFKANELEHSSWKKKYASTYVLYAYTHSHTCINKYANKDNTTMANETTRGKMFKIKRNKQNIEKKNSENNTQKCGKMAENICLYARSARQNIKCQEKETEKNVEERKRKGGRLSG